MTWSLFFGLLLVAVVILKYLKPRGERCPQCHAVRKDTEMPLCPECGWIFEVPGEEDDDYGEEEEEEVF
ncbi:MAG: hypothetical protein HOC74_07125 [Gemmatimonadetes bacterium]|jgi:hypothetical protein|nr:hypothetical protein [Gemmatimonadota bacterium]